MAAVKQREIDERKTLDDAGVVAVVDKLVKQRHDSVAAFRQGGREDLATQEEAEAAWLKAYLPQRLSADAVAAELAPLLASLGASGPGDMGRAMAAAKTHFGARADMATVSAAVKQALSRRAP
jgi:uncharacterized protein YqeY